MIMPRLRSPIVMVHGLVVPRLRSPIVLVHGLLGYDRVAVGGVTLSSYFPGIAECLRPAGNRVYVARLSPLGGVVRRANQLKSYLDRVSPAEPVHLIAHSMGGLDARYLISRLGMADRVLSLTTIATPHRGTTFADWGLDRFGRLLRPVFDRLDVRPTAIHDLSTAGCARFNESVPNSPDVRYFSVAGEFRGDWRRPEWHISRRIVGRHEGPNDGMVSVQSASFGESCEVWDGDHLSLVNWQINPPWTSSRSRPDRTGDYKRLVRRLADEGF